MSEPTAPPPRGRLALVLGASGYVGTRLVPRLVDAGWQVRAAARSRETLVAHEWQGVELVEADALVPASLDAVLDGVDVAYYLVHSMAAGRDFGRLDLEAAGNFARAAARAGVTRIVYLGGLVPRDARSEHLTSRASTGARLREGKVPVTEIRAGIIVGAGSAAFEVIRDLVNNLPVMVTPRWVHSRSPPIALDDLLEYLVAIPEVEAAAGRVLDAAGPEMLSYASLIRIYGECVGKRPIVIPVPVLTPTLSAWWLVLVTSVPTAIARALIAGLSHDIDADPTELARLVPRRLAGFREAVERALAAERQRALTTRWTEGHMRYRRFSASNAYYAKRLGASAPSAAPPDAAWRVTARIGGREGYFFANGLWRARALLDALVGGPGPRTGRRDPERLALGDRVDGWRVLEIEACRRLVLQPAMRAPGAGALEIALEPDDAGGTRVRVGALWHPRGLWGLAYWYALAPVHRFVFAGMARAIARRAELQAAEPGARSGPDPSIRP